MHVVILLIVVYVVRVEVGHAWLLSSFLRIFFSPYFFLIALSVDSLLLLLKLCCCYSQSSCHSFQIYLSAILPSHSLSSSPPISLHFLGFCSISLSFFISYSFNMSGPFQSTPHQFLLKLFLHSNFHSQFVNISCICSLHSHESSYPTHSPVVSLLVPSFLSHTCMPGKYTR